MKRKINTNKENQDLILINYKNFLSTRFDLVIRYYILEQVDFNAGEAKILALTGKYNFLRIVFNKLLTIDVKTKPGVAKKARLVSIHNYGNHVAKQLFYMTNWLWIEKNISNDWNKNNPYLVKMNGLGCSVKRFMASLKYDKKLYWIFTKKGKNMLSLWDENLYKELIESKKWKEIMKSKNHMIDKMSSLNFFSDDTYVGDKKLYEEYIRNIQT